jgi:serine/threonine protein kinase
MGWVYLAEVDLTRFEPASPTTSRGEEGHPLDPRPHRPTRFARWARRSSDLLRGVDEDGAVPYPSGGRCALKVLSTPSEFERFTAEWRALTSISHPNLIPVYGGGCWNDIYYYSMELVPDPLSIDRLIEELTLQEKVVVARDASRGLAAIHRIGIVHRDVSPSNLLVHRDEAGSLITRICDLGVSKDTRRAAPLTGTGTILGTPFYMSPEQVRASREVDQLTDVYSLGASLYHLVAGRAPYQGRDIIGVVERIVDGIGPDPIAEIAPQTPPPLQRFIERSMAFDPGDRPDSMERATEQLDRLILVVSDDSSSASSSRPATGGFARPRAPLGETPPPRPITVRDPRRPSWLAIATPLVPTLVTLGLSLALFSHWWIAFSERPTAEESTSPAPPKAAPVPLPTADDPPSPPPRREDERVHLGNAIESALRLRQRDRDFQRALAEIAALAAEALRLDLVPALEAARAEIDSAQTEGEAEWDADLLTAQGTPDLDRLARLLLLFDPSHRESMRPRLEQCARVLAIDPNLLPLTESRR